MSHLVYNEVLFLSIAVSKSWMGACIRRACHAEDCHCCVPYAVISAVNTCEPDLTLPLTQDSVAICARVTCIARSVYMEMDVQNGWYASAEMCFNDHQRRCMISYINTHTSTYTERAPSLTSNHSQPDPVYKSLWLLECPKHSTY